MFDTSPQGYERVAGSERTPLPNSRLIGPVNPNESVAVTIYLRHSSASNLSKEVQQRGRHLSREEYSANHSASPDDIAKVVNFARKNDLTIVETDPVGRKVVLAGTAATLSAAFATELQCYEHSNGTYRGRTGPLHVPAELDQVIMGVFGLDNRPQAQPHLKVLDKAGTNAASATNVSYTPVQVAQLYDFPTGAADCGNGQCIALIELGGGYNSADLLTYFQQLNIPMPTVTSVSVDAGLNQPTGTIDSADGEVDLDIEVAGAVAPGAHIAVYFAPNTDRGFLDAVTNAIHDSTNNPSVISISWGSAEANWTAQAMQAMDAAFQAAAAMGVTVCVAAGDNGSSDGVTDGLAHVDFPASSPYALACGGTRLDSTNNSAPMERVWNDANGSATGGGISDVFDLPAWQANAKVPPSVNANQRVGRGVPDVAGDADPQTGYIVYVDGQSVVFGGTSAVAPLWAGLIALINEQRGQAIGYLNPILYQNYAQLVQANALRDVTSGNNGAYSASPGWDACSGVGTPDGTKLRDALTPASLASASSAM
ncbi:MAG: S53 family peptidase [Ktedonobacteraceae bacterium]